MLCRLETFGQALDQLQRNRAMLTAAIEARDREVAEACALEAESCEPNLPVYPVRFISSRIRALIPKEDSRG
jgi:hypothetical protein